MHPFLQSVGETEDENEICGVINIIPKIGIIRLPAYLKNCLLVIIVL